MSDKERSELKLELNNIKNRVLYPILVVALLGIFGTGTTYIKVVRTNAKNIEKKVDQEKFNEYLSLQTKINALTEERQKILTQRVDALEENSKRIDQINIEIARLQEQIKNLLSDYSMRTRDGGEVIYPIDYFIKNT